MIPALSRFHVVASALAALFFLLSTLQPAGADIVYQRQSLTITTAAGKSHVFNVEIAATPDQRQRGLMYREEMAADHGMLFVFETKRRITMWMRNTVLALDMLFIDRDGVIRTIHEDAEPMSEAIIDSREAVDFVLELNAGTVRNLGLAPGDRVEAPAMAKP